MLNKICDNVFSFPITLPHSPLKYLNCYVIKSENGKNLLIDTGYALPESRRDLEDGMHQLELSPENTDVFITHIHADHAGNASYLAKCGYQIIMGKCDYEGIIAAHRTDFYGAMQKSIDAGVPAAILDEMFVHNPNPIMLPEIFPAKLIEADTALEYGGHKLKCLSTSGHSPGHISLYDAENEMIFLGDHVLFDISPNIVLWTWEDDALGEYLKSLRLVQDLPVKTALPAHRTIGSVPLSVRVHQLISHHRDRLNEIATIIHNSPGLNCYEIAGRMKWNLHATCWNEFPPTQKYFAVSECMAHLQHMLCTGRIGHYSDTDGIMRYYITD